MMPCYTLAPTFRDFEHLFQCIQILSTDADADSDADSDDTADADAD